MGKETPLEFFVDPQDPLKIHQLELSISSMSLRTWNIKTLLAAGIIAAGMVSVSSARPWRPGQIPNGSMNGCNNCHVDGNPRGSLTLFGEDVLPLVSEGGFEEFWGADLAKSDADGDGLTNGEELQDPDGVWMSGNPDPGDPGKVSNPGDPEDPPHQQAVYVRGDANADDFLDISDVVFTLFFSFDGQFSPTCLRAADSSNDGNVDISDVLFTLKFLFMSGSPPDPPFDSCGAELGNSGALECESFAPCS